MNQKDNTKNKLLRRTADLTYDEIYNEFIVKNQTCAEVAEQLCSTVDCVAAAVHKYGLRKTAEQLRAMRSRAAKKVPPRTPEQRAEQEKRRKQTLLSRYGDDYFQRWQKKCEETNIQKFGVSNAMFNPDVAKYQAERALQVQIERHDDILTTRINTVNARYGVDNVGQCEDHTRKMQNTSFTRYGAISYSSTEECKQKVHNTWSNKTSEEIRAIKYQSKRTCLERYGVEYYSLTPEGEKIQTGAISI